MTRRSGISKTRGWLYWAARLLGDLNAIQHGPHAIERRVEPRLMGKMVGRALWRLLGKEKSHCASMIKEVYMDGYSFLYLIGIAAIILGLFDIIKLLRKNDMDIYQTNLFGITKDGQIHPIIA